MTTMGKRLSALKACREELEETRVSIRRSLRSASPGQKRRLLASLRATRRNLEQCSIEIGLLEDAGALIRKYTTLQTEALENAEGARRASERKAFEDRAEFCRVVVEEVIEVRTRLKPITDRQLERALGELSKAAQEAKDTVDSINRAVDIANKVLGGLILLARVAASLGV